MNRHTPHHILLAVAGNTPATVTEAIWALAVDKGIRLSKAIILTTRSAEKQLHERLGVVLDDMKKDSPKQLAKLEFDVISIDADDIRTAEENDAAANWILEQTAAVCAQEDTVVHASIAGGRKTMSFYLGAAMQLVGRPQDKLYHVLVDPVFEAPDFFYPAKRDTSPYAWVSKQGGARQRTKNARIDMAEIPFVRFRGILRDEVIAFTKGMSFHQLSARAEDAINDQYLDLHVFWKKDPRIEFRDHHGNLRATFRFKTSTGVSFLVYTYLLHQRATGAEPLQLNASEHPDTVISSLEALQDWNRKLHPPAPPRDTIEALLQHLTGDDIKSKNRRSKECWPKTFASPISRLSEEMREALAEDPTIHPDKYFIQNPSGGRHLFVNIPPERIHMHSLIKHTTPSSKKSAA